MSTLSKQNYKGLYHFSPNANWMNDPNGMVFFEGEYHLFYQHHPYGMTWGPMHWGHAVSTDLLTWEELEIALFPDENGTIFSGSAVVDWNNTTGFFNEEPGLVAIFTHHLEADGKPPIQAQSLAYSKDKGRTWSKYEGNPVLTHDSFIDFRDPKVFWHEDSRQWIMIVACGQTVNLYRSSDLKTWSHCSEFGEGIGSHEGVWECPDLFPLKSGQDSSDNKWVMLVSIGASPEYPEGSRTQYFTGEFDGITFKPDQDSVSVRWLDYGRDNYAAVSWSDVPEDDGRRLIIGWMSNWMYANQTPTEGFRGAMTVPRELTLEKRKGKHTLVQKPVREIEKMRVPVLTMQNVSKKEIKEALSSIQLESYELIASFSDKVSVEFQVRKGMQHMTSIGMDTHKKEMYVDRTESGIHTFHELFASRHTARLEESSERLDLRILVDRSSVEVFGNDGSAVITDLIYPDASSIGISMVQGDEDAIIHSLSVYKISPPGSQA